MSRRSRSAVAEEVSEPVQEVEETRRTRSGRRVRPPAGLQVPEVAARTPSRRTRSSVIQESKEEEEDEDVRMDEGSERVEPEPIDLKAVKEEGEESSPVETLPSAPVETLSSAPVETAPVAALETVPAGLVKTPSTDSETKPKKKARVEKVTPGPVIPLGKPKSGRVWKDRNKKRFSTLVRDKQLCTSWEKKMQARRDKDLLKKYSSQLKAEKDRQKEEKRKRREHTLKRRAENERKAEIVQVIKNTSKIKRMKKKHLRKIEKRDTLAMVQKSSSQNPSAKQSKSKNQKTTVPGPDST